MSIESDREALERLKHLPPSRRLEILEDQMQGLLNLLQKYLENQKAELKPR